VFHACSNSLTDPQLAAATLEGMRRARRAGTLVSFDLNLRPALWPHDGEPRGPSWQALQLADVVKLSAEEFAWLADDGEGAVPDRLWRGATRLLVVTDAAQPLRWFRPGSRGELAGYRVDAVDSTGAGDAFVGGLLQQLAAQGVGPGNLDAWLDDLPRLQAALRYASACGALAVTRHGSFAAMSDAAEVDRFMEMHA